MSIIPCPDYRHWHTERGCDAPPRIVRGLELRIREAVLYLLIFQLRGQCHEARFTLFLQFSNGGVQFAFSNAATRAPRQDTRHPHILQEAVEGVALDFCIDVDRV